jgi:LmbE family N-acetylglucosaminyl deacetylase
MMSFLPHSLTELLCLGAHSDDIEIGAGGTVLRLLEQHPKLRVTWVVFSSNAQREAEARASAAFFLKGAIEPNVIVKTFRDGFFPSESDQIKQYFEQLKVQTRPDLILTHTRDDAHQDHRTINGLTWNTWRNHTILEYEIMKYDGDLTRPNVYVPLDPDVVAQKVQGLMTSFPSQAGKHWFDDETFRSILRLRGVESGTRYAEAFHGRKICL